MSVLTSRPVLRWALPAGLVAVVLGGGALVTTMQASADVRLPPRSAAQLLVDVQTARLEGVSGTVVERADLGLPAREVEGQDSGAHDLRVATPGRLA